MRRALAGLFESPVASWRWYRGFLLQGHVLAVRCVYLRSARVCARVCVLVSGWVGGGGVCVGGGY